ncbi:carbonic anhydrase family protein [Saccharothrix yanglingensis]|uniref:carbonic anhydrase family protein n=1 Tax=Saccharothrix yanglingensis TaxID=659496 RepID=UPI0027D28290|nr:carbonic anhydrase family protein [Saccharothrix yanglingensis]
MEDRAVPPGGRSPPGPHVPKAAPTAAGRGIVAIAVPVVLGALLTAGGTPVRFTPDLPGLEVCCGHSDLDLHHVRKDEAAARGRAARDHEETEEAEVEPGAAHVTLSGVRYDLVHFHTPSEHRFAGHVDPLEVHLVHRSASGGPLVVVGVPLRVGAPSTVDRVPARLAPECGEEVHVADVDLETLLPANRATARCTGSLTTAPFTEGVQWFLTHGKTVTRATVSRFRHLFHDGDARAPQPLNGRTVQADVPHV